MVIKPISLKEANLFVDTYHRHHKHVIGHKFSICCYKEHELVGVAIVGRPINRFLDNGKNLEVLRLCSKGDKNVCSKLYSTCAAIAKLMGYEKILTYIMENELGTSLKASSWICVDKSCGGGVWHKDKSFDYPICKKQRWEKKL